MIGLGLSLTTRAVLGLSFNPATLFAAGEQGILADLSDLSTLFTDTAGTTPVTAPGQTVALALDKSGRGNHLTQSVAAARPIYGRHPAGGIRNRLAATELFSDAYWAKPTLVTISPNVETAPDGNLTADKLVENSSNAQQVILRTITTSGEVVTASIYAKSAERSQIHIRNGNLGVSSVFDLSSGTVVSQGAGQIAAIQAVGNGWYRCSISFTSAVGSQQFLVGAASGGAISYLGNGSSGVFIWGAELKPGSTDTPYQRVGAPSGLAFPQPQSYDITEAGVPDVHYLFFDGLARWMVSPTITPGTDKAQIFAGVRKLSDAAGGGLIESSTNAPTNNGAIGLFAPAAARPDYGLASRGTIVQNAPSVSGQPAPISSAVTGIGDISGNVARLRHNGVQIAQSLGSQGTGNYLAYPLYIGSRAGTSLFLNGLIYSIVVRFGPNLPLATIQQVERWTAQRSGVTLP